ncbi:MAG: hypothetical protein O2955_19070, partial [Planctomycetota bacterium]|nr:hypothetical protein [Planctomycetota bacterium]
RTITDLTVDGEPLVRLLLCGQLSLEEKLAQPALEALNQRISTQVYLESFTRQESAEYIAHRLAIAGGRIDNVFASDALDLVVQASDGMPRCINQLCDHSLLLGYMVENKPINAEVAREALDDVKQLPLHWNEPTAALSPLDQLRQQAGQQSNHEETIEAECSSPATTGEIDDIASSGEVSTYEFQELITTTFEETDSHENFETNETVHSEAAVFEFGAEEESPPRSSVVEESKSALQSIVGEQPTTSNEWEEEVVDDPFSRLDADYEQSLRKGFRLQLPTEPITDDHESSSSILPLMPDHEHAMDADSNEIVIEDVHETELTNDEFQPICVVEENDTDRELPIDFSSCVADIFQSIEETSSELQALISIDMPTDIIGQWDTFSVEHDDLGTKTAYHDTDDVAFDSDDLADLDVPAQLMQALKTQSVASGDTIDQEVSIARKVLELIEDSQLMDDSKRETARSHRRKQQPEAPSPNTWFGSSDILSDMQEFDPFDDESSFASAKKFDIVQPDDEISNDRPKSQPLFPPTFELEDDSEYSPENSSETHPLEQQSRMISPKSFVRLFSELRKRQQRSA